MRLFIPLPVTFHFGSPMSYDKFVFPSYYLSLPILDIPFPVVKSSSHLIPLFPGNPKILVKFDQTLPCHLSKKMENTCPLGRGITPMSCVYNLKNHSRITLLRVIPTMTFIHFVTGISSGILPGISSVISSW